ncbi:uncharacterized protein B0P05DRAFT_543133 [Gilbertella persicaria]|uniref:Uncharacterized protein n=1 Tax=Rhizopus stolonifer TaxID=4846 RepID=A0A367KCS7_RHIST|nr:uncharacterized protein B0P05DRAFT_543133 [Gilbertella persicaria]KAI8078263.1 hypothetical protein B0P05DRAFT_543133 [Gilbertella persicaria]RCH99940.1 hypothetical protein CU098_009847 [Rhizopus stolonifer]
MFYRIAQKASFLASRQVGFQAARRIQPHIPNGSFHTTAKQLFASSHDWQQAPKHPLIDKIQQHPHIMQQLVDFTQILQSKGVDVYGKQPSFMQLMKVMNDVEVKEKVAQLAKDMQAAGIQLDMNTIQELQSSFMSPPSNQEQEQEQEEEQQRGRKRGVLSSVKGLFKK